MARILLLDGDVCLWNVLCEVLESEGYTVCLAHNDYEGLPLALPECIGLPRGTVLYVVVL